MRKICQILTILSATSVANFVIANQMEPGNNSKFGIAKYDVFALAQAICVYNIHEGARPENLEELVNGYILELPIDPWGNAYKYVHPIVWSDGEDLDNSSIIASKAPCE